MSRSKMSKKYVLIVKLYNESEYIATGKQCQSKFINLELTPEQCEKINSFCPQHIVEHSAYVQDAEIITQSQQKEKSDVNS